MPKRFKMRTTYEDAAGVRLDSLIRHFARRHSPEVFQANEEWARYVGDHPEMRAQSEADAAAADRERVRQARIAEIRAELELLERVG